MDSATFNFGYVRCVVLVRRGNQWDVMGSCYKNYVMTKDIQEFSAAFQACVFGMVPRATLTSPGDAKRPL